MSCLCILPFIANDKRALQIQVPFEGGFGEQTRSGLAAGAIVLFAVRAEQNTREAKTLLDVGIHPLKLVAGLQALREAGLVHRRKQDIAGGLQLSQRLLSISVEMKIGHRQRHDLLLLLDRYKIQNPVSLKKNR